MFYLDFFRALEVARVRYLVVGGIAVNLHGVNRLTADIDLMIALDAGNLARFIPVAKQFEMKPVVPVAIDDLANAAKVEDWIKNKHMLAFGLRPKKAADPTVDILIKASVAFDEAYARRITPKIADLAVSVASIEDIIRMKTGTGRQKDEADIRSLKRLLELRK